MLVARDLMFSDLFRCESEETRKMQDRIVDPWNRAAPLFM